VGPAMIDLLTRDFEKQKMKKCCVGQGVWEGQI